MKLADFDFRIWDNEKRKYIDTIKSVDCNNCGCGVVDFKGWVLGSVDEIELWTGFKDKNGVKIFENDIFKEGEATYQVVRFSHNNTLIAKKLQKNPRDFSDYVELCDFKEPNAWEVVGNIHDLGECEPPTDEDIAWAKEVVKRKGLDK